MKKWINTKLPSGSFVRHVITLMTGTTFAQALMILVMPILTRVYSPENFGIFALYTSILGVLGVISCWRYEIAIVLPENDENSANLLVLSVIICISMAAATLILLIVFGNMLSNILGAPELFEWLWFLPISLMATGCFQAFNYWSTRHKKFKRLAIQQMTQSSVTATTQVTGGLTVGAGAGGLIGGSILGQTVATAVLALNIWKDDRKTLALVSIQGMKKQASIYKEFPLYQIWASLLNIMSGMAPIFLLSYFFSPEIVGFYSLGQRVVTAPMGVVARSISQVFYPRAEIARREGTLDILVLSIFQKLLILGLFPICLMAIIGPEIIAFVFGHEWQLSGIFLRFLSPFLLLNFLSAPISSVFSVLNKQKEYLLFNVCYLIFGTSALMYGGITNNINLAIILFSVSASCLYVCFGGLILRMSGVSGHSFFVAFIHVLKPVVISVVMLLVVKSFFKRMDVLIVFCILISACYYTYILNKGQLGYAN